MKKPSLLTVVVFGLLISNSAISSPRASQWSPDVSSSDVAGHADSVKTNTNFGIVNDNVKNLSSDLNSAVGKQNDINSAQKIKNANQDDLNNQQRDVNTSQKSLNSQQEALNDQQRNVNTTQKTWNSQQEGLNDQQRDVNTTQKTWNSQQEGLNDQQRSVNTKQTATNKKVGANLNKLNSDVNWLNGRVDSLDHQMKRGLASQAALSGLFQPYSVGKFNLSMSVGGYESTNALAIGSGYRLSEQVAAKIGVASNTEDFKGTSYNAAVNFEW